MRKLQAWSRSLFGCHSSWRSPKQFKTSSCIDWREIFRVLKTAVLTERTSTMLFLLSNISSRLQRKFKKDRQLSTTLPSVSLEVGTLQDCIIVAPCQVDQRQSYKVDTTAWPQAMNEKHDPSLRAGGRDLEPRQSGGFSLFCLAHQMSSWSTSSWSTMQNHWQHWTTVPRRSSLAIQAAI